MAVVGVGIDVVDISRFGDALRRTPGLVDRLFTAAEASRPLASLAARFAAKEACLKALGTGRSQGISFLHVEVVRTDGGAPVVHLSGPAADRARDQGVRRVHVSLTHQPGIAAAAVILEG